MLVSPERNVASACEKCQRIVTESEWEERDGAKRDRESWPMVRRSQDGIPSGEKSKKWIS